MNSTWILEFLSGPGTRWVKVSRKDGRVFLSTSAKEGKNITQTSHHGATLEEAAAHYLDVPADE